MERTPPANVRRTLREEVGFMCPIEGCCSPYLTYHHFCPTWAEKQHHNPEGMIALCLQHHKEADVGTYTIDQLKELKKTAKDSVAVAGRFNWKRENTLIIAGSNFFIGSPTILEASGRKMIWFEKDENNYDIVNMDLLSANGELLFQMRNNDWLAHPSFDDIEAPPSAKWLKIRSKANNISLDLNYSNRDIGRISKIAEAIYRDSARGSVESYNKHLPQGFNMPKRTYEGELKKMVDKVVKYVSDNLGQENITTCQVSLKIAYPLQLALTPTKLEARIGQSRFMAKGCLMGNATVVKI